MSSNPNNLKFMLALPACATVLSVSTNAMAQADPIEHCREAASTKTGRLILVLD